MPDLPLPTFELPRDLPLNANRLERFLGRLTLAAIGVLVVLVVVEMVIPGDEVDAVWLATAAAVILLARQVGFWPSVVVAFGAAAVIVVLIVRPAGALPVGTVDDLAALVLFLIVAVLGASAVSSSGRRTGPARIERSSPALVEPLTAREREILGLLVAGMSNQEIARFLVVSPNTVKTHLEHLYGKLSVSSRLQATARAYELDLVSTSTPNLTRRGDERRRSG